MDKLSYFKLACQHRLYAKKAWIVSAFTIVNEDPDAYKSDPYNYRLVQSPTGISYVYNNELIAISDAKPGLPLYNLKDSIVVDSSFCPNAKQPITTTYGNVLVNLIALVNAFNTKIPFMTGKIDVATIEDIIAPILTDDVDDISQELPDRIYVREYIKFVDSLAFLAGLTLLCVWTVTEKSLSSPEGLKEFKESLIAKYGDTLTDPVQLAAFEKELQQFDEAYLKDDPSATVFISGKVKNMARKKMFLNVGGDAGFGDGLKLTPITNSLEEGWPKDPDQFVAMMNSLRFGSYSRGNETKNGGTTAKTFLRAGNNIMVLPEDCGTQLGITRRITSSLVNTLVGRYIRINNQWQFIDSLDLAKQYLDKIVMLRSPMYCKQPGDRICKYCAGIKLAENKFGISTALTEISNIVMLANMKQTHGTVLATTKLNLAEIFS
jgi:hypothetical protein